MATKRMSQEEFEEMVYKVHGDNVTVLGPYIGNKKKVQIQCNRCKKKRDIRADHLKDGQSCFTCSRSLTNDEFIARLDLLHNKTIKALDEYQGMSGRIRFMHDVEDCGYIWYSTPGNVLRKRNGILCAKCNGKAKITYDEFLQRLRDVHDGRVELIGEFTRMHDLTKFRCTIDGYEWYAEPNGVVNQGTGCKACAVRKTAESQTLPHDIFVERVNDVHDGEIEVMSPYVNAKTPVTFRHKRCQRTWTVLPYNVLSGNGCSFCQSSKGEFLIRRLLNERDIRYVEQYRIDDCRSKKPLPFDFAFVGSDDTLLGLCEYQGIQHYSPVERFGGDEEFQHLQKRDDIKLKYCERNNIPLLCIPYWLSPDEVETILDDFLFHYISKHELAV